MKRSFWVVVVFVLVFASKTCLATGVVKSPDKKKTAYVNKSGQVIVKIKNKETVLMKIRPDLDWVRFFKWSPKSDALVYVVDITDVEASRPRNCYAGEVCVSSWQIYIYQPAKNLNMRVAATTQPIGSASFGGVMAFSYKTSGDRKELCWKQTKGCSQPIIFGNDSVSFAINLTYFVDDSKPEQFITEIPSNSEYGDYLFHSLVFTVDYNGNVLKQSNVFKVHDSACCMPGD